MGCKNQWRITLQAHEARASGGEFLGASNQAQSV